MFPEKPLLPLSAHQHWLYCPRHPWRRSACSAGTMNLHRHSQHRQFCEVPVAGGKLAAGLQRLGGDPDVIGGDRFPLVSQEKEQIGVDFRRAVI